ncbi:hypothetical protein ACFO5Q_09490 [Kordiimonas lipolytica]|uniref:PAS domain-containing protein n=2 Tax=Kordiimonas lipolytica TaxID=1662421 RepID=A0ABV8UB20_9PROT
MGKVSAFDMNALDSRIRELVAYARERDGEDRTTLFRSLVDMFLTGKAPVKEPTRAQLLDVVEALIPHVDPDSRRTVSEILAGQAKPPMDLVHRLVRDRASLMEDLLKNAPFDEDDIIELITQTGREHHQILATRTDLSANVWIALARAAPAAPPFEGRSTLALWRDDLGTQPQTEETQDNTRTEADVAAQHEEQHLEEMEPRRVAVGGGGTTVMTAGSTGDSQGFAATVTRLRPEGFGGAIDTLEKKAASLRILRTDEDLIAERMNERPAMPETKMVGTSDSGADSGRHQLTDTAATPTTAHTPEAAMLTETVAHAEPRLAAEAKPRFLRDPGPGGWAWRSDRDGFITLVSPFAARIFGGAGRLVGTAMLDMLGLNTKLDHPVSRAFQRRSTIHDAPISLPQLDTGHQHWTLEAAPVFNPSSGVFEGFEGILTPVRPASEGKATDTLTYDQPLFLDEEHESPKPAERQQAPEPASFADSPSVLQSGIEKPQADIQAKERMADSDITPDAPATDTQKRNPLADMINSTAAAMVREAVSDALSPMTPQQEAARYGRQETTEDPAPVKQPDASNEEVLATLQLLEESLARLTEAGEKGAIAQVRLQSEIATACARALRDQLKK